MINNRYVYILLSIVIVLQFFFCVYQRQNEYQPNTDEIQINKNKLFISNLKKSEILPYMEFDKHHSIGISYPFNEAFKLLVRNERIKPLNGKELMFCKVNPNKLLEKYIGPFDFVDSAFRTTIEYEDEIIAIELWYLNLKKTRYIIDGNNYEGKRTISGMFTSGLEGEVDIVNFHYCNDDLAVIIRYSKDRHLRIDHDFIRLFLYDSKCWVN